MNKPKLIKARIMKNTTKIGVKIAYGSHSVDDDVHVQLQVGVLVADSLVVVVVVVTVVPDTAVALMPGIVK